MIALGIILIKIYCAKKQETPYSEISLDKHTAKRYNNMVIKLNIALILLSEFNIYGELSEWSKVQHSKCCVQSNEPRVRIPNSPPDKESGRFLPAAFSYAGIVGNSFFVS